MDYEVQRLIFRLPSGLNVSWNPSFQILDKRNIRLLHSILMGINCLLVLGDTGICGTLSTTELLTTALG